jgi:hypothetical protein
MGTNLDSKAGSQAVGNNTLQPTATNQSKAAEASGVYQQNVMATIADDDDRLLVRIGYTPVSAL